MLTDVVDLRRVDLVSAFTAFVRRQTLGEFGKTLLQTAGVFPPGLVAGALLEPVDVSLLELVLSRVLVLQTTEQAVRDSVAEDPGVAVAEALHVAGRVSG